jgi:hypothetical protein
LFWYFSDKILFSLFSAVERKSEMTKKHLLLIPSILILNSIVLSLYSLYSAPSHYAMPVIDVIWMHLFAILGAVFFALNVKAKYWGVSIIALALAGLPRALIDTIPVFTNILVAITLTLDTLAAAALFAAYRYDTLDLTRLESGKLSRASYLLLLLIALVIMAEMYLNFRS